MVRQIDSEQAVLSILITYAQKAHSLVEEIWPDYFGQDLRPIYQAIKSILAEGGEPDLMLVSKRTGKPAEVSALTSLGYSLSSFEYHLKKIRDYQVMNLLKYLSNEISDAVQTAEDPDKVVEGIEKRLTQLSITSGAGYMSMSDLMLKLTDRVQALYEGKIPEALQSGLSDLDSFLRGINKQEMIVIAARPSIGKTAFGLTMAYNMSKAGHKVGFFSCEMSGLQLSARLTAIAGGSPLSVIHTRPTNSDMANLAHTMLTVGEYPMWIDDTPNIKLSDLIKQARLMKRKEKVEVIFIDYMSLIQHGNHKQPLWERVGEISARLKQLARELDIPVIVLSQVGRDSEQKEPTLADLRYSGSIEQDADMIIFLHRERESDGSNIPTQVIVAKNRNGATGRCDVLFMKQQTKFVGLQR